MTRARSAVITLVGIDVLVVGFVGGIAAERVRSSRARAVVLEEHEAAARRLHERLMDLERAAPPSADAVAAGHGGWASGECPPLAETLGGGV